MNVLSVSKCVSMRGNSVPDAKIIAVMDLVLNWIAKLYDKPLTY